MANSFYLQIGDAAPQLFRILGLDKLSLKIGSQKASSFGFSANTDCEGDPLADEGTICTVYIGDGEPSTPFFSGRLHEIPRSGSARGERVNYELLDAWHDFERNVFQQQWNVVTGTDESGNPTTSGEYRSECILGMDVSGDALNSGDQIGAIVAWAISVGANCQIGDIGVGAPVPFDEITDLPCSECIKKMLRWTPDAVAWFDYSTTPPTFNVTRRPDCTAVYLELEGGEDAVEIKALTDLVPPGVLIRFIQVTNSNAGAAQIEVIVDDYPGGTNGTEYGALVMTCRLAEGQSTYQKQKVKAAAFPIANSGTGEGDGGGDTTDGGPSNDPLILFWQRKVSWLKNLGESNPSFTPADIGDQLIITNMWGTFDVGEGDDDGTGGVALITDGAINEDYPNELLQGQIADWMSQTVAKTTWTALVSYSFPSDPTSFSEQDNQALLMFGGPVPADDGSTNSVPILVTGIATATNATAAQGPGDLLEPQQLYGAGEPAERPGAGDL